MKKSIVERDSNIEVLRILATLGVFFLHFNTALNGSTFNSAKGINANILYVLETLFICGVDLLVLITGYFSVKSNKCNLWKPIELIFQNIVLASVIPFFIEIIAKKSTFSVGAFVWKLLNIGYFVVLYSVMYLLSPFINHLLTSISKKNLSFLIVAMFLLFSVYPTFISWLSSISGRDLNTICTVGLFGDGDGYTIVNFLMMYSIGAYLRLSDIESNKRIKWLALALPILFIAIYFWSYNGGFGPNYVAWKYSNPLVVLVAICLFLIFRRINFGKNKVINCFAKSSFTFFILHAKFIKLLDVNLIISKSPLLMTAYIVSADICIYIIIWVIWWIWSLITTPLFNLIENKFKQLMIEIKQ